MLAKKAFYQKLLPLSMAGCLALTSLAACSNSTGNANKGSMYKNDVRPNNMNSAYRENGQNNVRWNQLSSEHRNTVMINSQEIAARIAALNGVDSARVIITNNNAYVGVVLDRMNNRMGNTTTNGFDNTYMNPQRSSTSYNSSAIGETGTGTGTGTGTAMPNRILNSGTMNGNTMNGNTSGNSNYSNDVTTALKAQIASIVKSMHPNVRNVYVSANPDFIGSMSSYIQQASSGHPIKGLMDEFNMMVERVFPTRITK